MNKNEFSKVESNGNKTNLSNLSTSEKFTEAGYLISNGAIRGGGNINKGVEVAKVPIT